MRACAPIQSSPFLRALRALRGQSLVILLAMPPVASAQNDDRRASYLAHIAAAEASLRLNETAAGRRWLDGAPEDLRGWEWRYLRAQVDQSLGTVGPALGSTVYEVAFSRDGARLAAACEDGSVVVRDVASGSGLLRIAAHQGTAYRVAFSPDGASLATSGADKRAKIWDAASGALKIEYAGFNTPVTGVAFSPDGARVASCNYRMEGGTGGESVVGTLKIWDPATGKDLAVTDAGNKPVSMIRWSPDGARLAASSWNGHVYVWNPAGGGPCLDLPTPEDADGRYNALNCVGWSPDGTRVVAGSKDQTGRVWDSASGALIATLTHAGWVTWTEFTPDGARLATASHDGLVRLWDAATWKEAGVLRAHAQGPWCLAVSPDGSRIVSAGIDRALRAWDAAYPDYGDVVRQGPGGCYAAVFAADGRWLATCAYDGSLSLWDTAAWDRFAHWTAHEGQSANVLSASADGRRLATCSWDKTVKTWSGDTGALIATATLEAGVYHAAISPDGALVAAAPRNKTLVVTDAATGGVVRTIAVEANAQCVAFSPDGRWVAAAHTDKAVRVFDARSGEPRGVLAGLAARAESCAFSADGTRIAAGDGTGHVAVWDAAGVGGAGGAPLWSVAASDAAVYRVAFSPDGTRLAAGGTHCVLLDAADGAAVLTIRPKMDGVWNLSFGADGERLAMSSADGRFTVLDTAPMVERVVRRNRAIGSRPDTVTLVDRVLASAKSAGAAAEAIRADPTLGPSAAGVALNELLRRSAPRTGAPTQEGSK